MPRKRRITKLRTRQLTWGDVTIREQLDFLHSGWSPPAPGERELGCWLMVAQRQECPWQTWTEYLTDWSMVREDALEYWQEHHADHLAHHRAQVASREAELRKAEQVWQGHAASLYETALEHLAEEEARELPFAEIQYQRALQGLPVGREEEEVELSAEDGS